MPAIQAYKSKGKIIPLADAKVGKAYQCPWTEELFATKRGYVNHLVSLRETRMHRRARKNIHDRKFAEFYNQPKIKSIVNWIETNPEFFFDNAIKDEWEPAREKMLENRNKFWIKITYLDLTYSECVSNSHNAPRGKPTNWGRRDKNVPGGYPGFAGNIEFQISHELGWGSDLLKRSGINTGTGGGTGNLRFGYDVKIFLEDFPALKKAIEDDRLRYDKSQLLEMIKNQHKPYRVMEYRSGTARYFKR